MKLGMEPYVLKLYKVYINDDSELTLTYFKTMSNLTKFFSSPEPLGSQGELIVYPSSRRPSVIRPSVRPPFSKIFFSETAWPIKAKFYVEPPWEEGIKVCINGPDHMTKMAATLIYGKKPLKSSSPEPGVL